MAAEFTDPAAAAERAAALTGLLTGGGRGASEVAAVLRDFGEPEPITITDADLAGLRRVAAALRQVFAAPDAGTAARLLNDLLAASAGPPRPEPPRRDGLARARGPGGRRRVGGLVRRVIGGRAGHGPGRPAGGAGRPVRGAGLRGPVRGHAAAARRAATAPRAAPAGPG